MQGPATLAGAAQTFCTQSGSCHVRTFLPAGSDPETGETWFISRVDHDPLPFDPLQCPSIGYHLVVARGAKIADHEVWERRSAMQFDRATLRVNGCVPPTIEPTMPILRHPFG